MGKGRSSARPSRARRQRRDAGGEPPVAAPAAALGTAPDPLARLLGHRAWPALAAVAAVAAHAPALRGGFVWLDHAHLERGLAIAPPARWMALFAEPFAGTGYYRPLTSLSLSIDAAVGGGPLLFHAVTLGWHALAAAMVALLAERFGLGRRAALLAGVLFAVHPATSLVASAIAFRSEAMTVVALCALLLAHRGCRPLLAAAALLGGALIKETALLLGPLCILALELAPGTFAGEASAGRGARTRLWAAEAAALVVAVALRLVAAPGWRASMAALSPSEAIGTRLASFTRAAVGLVLPVDVSVCDATIISAWYQPAALAGAAVLAAMGWLAWKRRGPALLLALALLPVAQLVPVPRWWSIHYLYVPLAFGVMLVAERVARSARPRAFQAAVAGAACLALASIADARRFASDERLWRPEVEADAACREGQFHLAEVARQRQELEAAEAGYLAALAERPGVLAYVDRAAALQNLGLVRQARGDLEGARAAWAEALPRSTGEARAELTHNLGALALQRGDAADAWQLLEGEAARPDARPQTIYLAAKAAHALGLEPQARELIARLRAMGWDGASPGEIRR
jgi:hypothetical protein